MARTKFYKLGEKASMFYDLKNTLKVTRGVPGRTNNVTKTTMDGSRSGHIIEINEQEYDNMMAKLPEGTRKAILKDQKSANKEKPKAAEPEKDDKKIGVEDEDEDKEENSEERTALLERLGKLELSKKEKKKALAMDDEDLGEFLDEKESE